MNYTLMNKNHKILKCEIDDETGEFIKIDKIYDLNFMSPGIAINNGYPDKKNLNKWWLERSIPNSRKGLKFALDEMGVDNPKSLITKCYGLSLSDQYWILPVDQKITWDSINYFDNSFTDYVGDNLLGKNHTEEEKDLASPCNTSGGNLVKKWTIKNGKRYLIKGGSGVFHQEPYNEVLASALHRRLKVFPYVKYNLVWEDLNPYSSCKNFITKNTELVAAYQVLNMMKKPNEISYYQHIINISSELGIKKIQSHLDYMMITDYIIGNVDRHYNNFGFIRNVETLQYEGVAPIYDSGNAMWFDTSTQRIDYEKDIHSMPFKKIHSEQIKLVSSYENIDLKMLHGIEEEYNTMLLSSPDIDEPRIDKLCKGLQYRIQSLETEREKSVKKTLFVSNNESIEKGIKSAKYKVTTSLVSNIRKLSELQGKAVTLVDILLFVNIKNMSEKENYLLKVICEECSKQDSHP